MSGPRGALVQDFCCSIHLLKLPLLLAALSCQFASHHRCTIRGSRQLIWGGIRSFSSEATRWHSRKNVLHTLKMQTVNYCHPLATESSSCGAPPAHELHSCTLESNVAKWKRSRQRGGFGDNSPPFHVEKKAIMQQVLAEAKLEGSLLEYSTEEWCHKTVNKGPFLGHCRDQAGVVTALDAQRSAQTLA